ncbi:MAG: hypothetical protein QXD77_00755 [Candidatus Aenigmatarchaeota archaeon]
MQNVKYDVRSLRTEFPFPCPKTEQKPKYETEIRGEGHQKIPEGFELSREFSFIEDAYFTTHPRNRFRRAVMKYPTEKFIGKWTSKKLSFDYKGTGEVVEHETGAEDPQEAFTILRTYKDPVLKVCGTRKEYRNPEDMTLTICQDEVFGLGKYTELERMNESLLDVPRTQAELLKMLKDMGAKTPIRKDYVDMRMEQEVVRFIEICNYWPTMQTLMGHFCSDSDYMKLVIDRLEEQGKVVRAGLEIVLV